MRIARKFRVTDVIALVVFSLGFSGCQVATNDSTASQGPLKLALPNQECLKSAMPTIKHFFEGTATEGDLNGSWGCFGNALRMFMTSTRGENPDYYTARELRTFLEAFFLGDVKISDPLLNDAMKVKQLLVGGAIDRITRPELVQAQTVLEVLRAETQRLRPYMSLITMSEPIDSATATADRTEAALLALNQSSAAIGELFGHAVDQYDSESLQNLFNELKPLFKDWSGPTTAIGYLPTFVVAKSFLLNPPGNRILPKEWQPLLSNAGRFYSLYLRMHYEMTGEHVFYGKGLTLLTQSANEIYDLLKGAIVAKPDKSISFSLTDSVVDEVFRLNIPGDSYRDTTIKGMVRSVVSKVLNPMTKGSRPTVKGLNLATFAHLQTEVSSFLDMQRMYQDVKAQAIAGDPKYVTEPIPMPLVRQLWAQTPTNYPIAKENFTELFNQTNPLSFRDNGTNIFDNRLSYVVVGQRAFNRYNLVSSAIRLIMKGYATDAKENRLTGLTSDQLHTVFSDLHELGVDLEIFFPNDDTLWKTAFDDSNVFTLSANPDDHANFVEAFDFMSYMLGGAKMTHRAYHDGLDNCAHLGEDVFHNPTIDMVCFRKHYMENFATTYAELPWWVKTYNDLGPSKLPDLMNGLESAGRKSINDTPIATTDITRMTMVMQYIEAIYTRFDKDRSGSIDFKEANAAFPLFKDLLNSASKFNDDKKNLALFCYLLEYGKAPTSLLDKAYFQLIWLPNESKWEKVSADRMQILKIVSALQAARGN